MKILGVRVDFVNLTQALSLIEDWVNISKQYQITTPNPEHIVMCQTNYRLKKIINNSSLAICDGAGLVIAGQLLKLKIKNKKLKTQIKNNKINKRKKLHRLSGTDLMIELCKLAYKKNWRVFLLGGKNGAAKKAAKKLNISISQYLNIKYYSGAKNSKKETASERKEVIQRINAFRPHLLFVAYGAPWQEYWIADNLAKLNVKVAMGVGGAFDFLAGKVKRAPSWVRKIGLEWFYRLLNQPWRIKRQFNLIKFMWLVLTS